MDDDRTTHAPPRRLAPLWLLLATALTLAYAATVPAPGASSAARDLLAVAVVGLVPVGLGAGTALLVVACLCGWGDARAALRHLLGRAGESELPRAARALRLASRWVEGLGLAVAAMALLGILNAFRFQSAEHSPLEPRDLALFVRAVLLSVPAGVLLGRFVLGTAAEAAALRAALPARRPSAAWLLASIALPVALVTLMFVKYPTL